MGIQGLIPFLEKASKPTNINEFSGGTAAIDAYCWLHKGVFSCAERLARGEETDMYVSYCMKFINMLLAKNVKPILVFDGQKLPAKMETEEKRRELRERNRKKAAELMRLDRSKEAQTYLRRCVDITHEMALNLIRVCRTRNVDCIVAPYEADAQLAFLNMQNLADVIVTEDSDLLLFGAKKVLFKMDMNGNGLLVEQSKLYIAMGVKEKDFSLDKFRYMCILSGCDYLSSLSGIGLVKACRFIKRTADPDIYRALTRLSLNLNMPQLCVTEEYRNKFMEADFMFKYQPVYDPRERRLRPLNDLNPEDENYVQYKNLIDVNNLSEEQLKNLAYGNIDPFKLTEMDSWSPSKLPVAEVNRKGGWSTLIVAPYSSIWSENYEPNSWTKPKVEPPNALRPSAATKTNKGCSLIVEVSDRRNLPLTKKVVLPKVNRDAKLENVDNLYSPIVDSSDDDTEGRVTIRRNKDQHLSTITCSVTPLPKKTHHNPFLKSSMSTFVVKKNVSMLDKLQQLCHATENDAKETCSGYFGGNVSTATNVSPKASTISNHHNESLSVSPIMSGRCLKSKISLDFEEYDALEPRSPLKTLNASLGDSDNDLCVISQKYSIPTSGDENLSQQHTDKEQQETESSRKRMIPFAATSTGKKPRVQSFIEKLNSFRRRSINSSFTWSQPEKDEKETTLNIGNSAAVCLNFKKPMVGCRTASVPNSDKISSQSSDEDEGFCSADMSNGDLNHNGTESGTENISYSPPAKKLNWVSCRMSGLKKSGPKQLSLDQYAFKSAVKMKR